MFYSVVGERVGPSLLWKAMKRDSAYDPFRSFQQRPSSSSSSSTFSSANSGESQSGDALPSPLGDESVARYRGSENEKRDTEPAGGMLMKQILFKVLSAVAIAHK